MILLPICGIIMLCQFVTLLPTCGIIIFPWVSLFVAKVHIYNLWHYPCSSFNHYLLVRKSCEEAKIWVQIKSLEILFTEFWQANQYPSSIWATIQLLNIRKSIQIPTGSDSSIFDKESVWYKSYTREVKAHPQSLIINLRSWLNAIISMQRILTGVNATI